MGRRFRVAVLGGTFDHLHAGHRALLARAFEVAERVGIGITTDRYLATHPKERGRQIRSYSARRRGLLHYLHRFVVPDRYWVVPLNDAFGRSIEPGVDALIASEETGPGARAVNRERKRRGLPPVQILLIPRILADDLIPISATRIRAGLLDPDGRRTTPIRVEVLGRFDRATLREIQGVVRRLLPARVNVRAPQVGTADRRRAPTAPRQRTAEELALQAARHADYGVGVAGKVGLRGSKHLGLRVAVADGSGALRPTGAARVRARPPIGEQLTALFAERRTRWKRAHSLSESDRAR